MITNIKDILKKLDIDNTGYYDNHFYIIPLKDSNEYARVYTKLDKNAVNTEYPDFAQNTNGSTTKITCYFELEHDNIMYNIFLFADFNEDKYYIKIVEKDS